MPRNRVPDPPLLLTLSLTLAASLAACFQPDRDAPPGAAGHGDAAADAPAEAEEHEEGIVELSPEAVERAGLRTARVELRPLASILETTGTVDFDRDRLAHVSPRLPGRVHEVLVDLGDEVAAGSVMARIDSIELGQAKSEYLQAKALAELAQENFDREQRLFAQRISSEQETLAAQAAHREAQATLKAAEETLHLYGLGEGEVATLGYEDPRASIYVLRAPFAGKVVEKHITRGELVTPESDLLLLADLSRVWIWIDVYERDLPGVHVEDRAEVLVDAFPGEVFRGEVSYLSDQVDVGARTIRARLEVDNPGGRLRPGMFARIRLSDPHGSAGEAPAEAVTVAPEGAVQRDGDEFVAFVALGDGRFERRELRVGRRAGGFAEIVHGLAVGEEVVAEGTFLLKSEAAREELGGGHGH